MSAPWTQPVCTNCWVEENSIPDPDDANGMLIRQPVRAKLDEFIEALHTCCKCGRATTSNIFIRVDPSTVAYASVEDDG